MGRIIQDVKMTGQSSPNLREISELQNEGGSDVFTSTSHINNTQNNSDYKLKFWTQDDAPIIRPLLKTETNRLQGKPAEISMGVNNFKPDGYGGIACERVTKLGARTTTHTGCQDLGFGLACDEVTVNLLD